MSSKNKTKIGCFYRLTEGDASYCILQSNRFLEATPPQRTFVFHGSKEGLLLLCDGALLNVCPFRTDSEEPDRSRPGRLIPCSFCKKRHYEGSTAKRLCEEWSSVKLVLKELREKRPEGRRYYEMGTTELPYSESTPDLVRRLIWIRVKSAVLRRDRYICQDCGADFGRRRRKAFDPNARRGRGGYVWESLEVHHIIPRSKRGSDHPGNLVTLCPACHRKYTSELMVEFIEERKRVCQIVRSIRELPDDHDEWDFRGE
ncbi:MAG: HNH endonuclease [Methanomassiliicoccales archaeon]|nr:HNH endonuclease [Methanomassiliicoccales archaeon]